MLKASLVALLTLSFAAMPVLAQARPAPITKGVTTGDLSVQVQDARQLNADLMVQINVVRDDVARLNGQVEALEFQLAQVRDANIALTTDNDTLARELRGMRAQADVQSRAITAMQLMLGLEPEPAQQPGAPAAPATLTQDTGVTVTRTITSSGPTRITGTGSPATGGEALPEGSLGTLPASALPGEAGPLFAEAKTKLLQLDYAGSEAAFRTFLDRFGSDPQAGEAYFWLGEALHQQQAYAESGAAYTTMIRSFPDDARAPDALVRLARAMRLLGDTDKSCVALDTLPKRYPNASKIVRDLAAVERTRAGCKT